MDENPLLQKVIDDAESAGYVYLTDQVTCTTFALTLVVPSHFSPHYTTLSLPFIFPLNF